MQEFFQGQMGQALVQLLPLIALFGLMYLVMIKPQQKRKKQEEELRKSIVIGDEVVTIGGIHGVISSTKENTVIVKVDDNTKIEFNRSAIASLVTEKTEKEETSKKGKDKAVEEKTDTDKSEEK